MIRINLLPWRARLRAQSQRRTRIIFISSSLLLLFLCVSLHLVMKHKVRHLSSSTFRLEQYLLQLKERPILVSPDEVLHQLIQVTRTKQLGWIEFFDMLRQATLHNIHLLTIQSENKNIQVTGTVDKMPSLLDFIEICKRYGPNFQVKILSLRTLKSAYVLEFRLQFMQKSLISNVTAGIADES